MAKAVKKPAHISQADWDAVDVPELTDEDFARAKPFKEVFPKHYAALKQRGRPPIETPKKLISFRLDADVVDGIKATGKGYNILVEQALRELLGEQRAKEDKNVLRLPPPIKSGKVAAKPVLAKKAAPAKASPPLLPARPPRRASG
jgi:uncharacterized protein (DUF4415 family)